MEIAGIIIIVIPSVAGLLTILWLTPRLIHSIRFRRPKFVVEKAEVSLEQKEGVAIAGPGRFLLHIRGAAHPVRLTERELMVRQAPRVKVTSGTETVIDIPASVWTRRTLVFEACAVLEQTPLPTRLDAEIYLSHPDDAYVVPIRLRLSEDGSRYEYWDKGAWRRHLDRTVLRHYTLLRRLIRAATRGRFR